MKRSRFDYQAASRFGQTLRVRTTYSLTKVDILQTGYQFIEISDMATLTLPAADEDLEGICIRVATLGQGVVAVDAGFGGRGSSFDTVQNTDGETVDFWCGKDSNGASQWYALSPNVTASGSLSSSSSSSSSSSRSSSSSSSSST